MDTLTRKRDRWLAFLLCGYLAAPLYPIPFVGFSWSLLLLALLIMGAGRCSHDFRLRAPEPLALWLVWLCGSVALSFGWNYAMEPTFAEPGAAMKYLAQFVLYSFACVIGYSLFTSRTFARQSVAAFAVGIGIVSLFVLGEYLLFGGLRGDGWSHLTRMSQNSYGVQFSTFLPFVYGAIVGFRRKGFWTLVLICCISAVLVNNSRTAWITTALTASIFLLTFALVKRRVGLAVAVAFFGLVSVLAIWSAVPDSIAKNVTLEYETFNDLRRDKSWMIRQLQVQKAEELFEEHPILGVGPGQFRFQVVALDMPDVLASRSAFDFNDVSAHNSYIQFLAECGLLFTAPYIGLVLWLAVAGFRASTALLRRGEVWGLSLYSGLVGMSVHFWTISGLTTTGPWFIYGAAVALVARSRIQHEGLRMRRAGHSHVMPA